MCVATVRRDLPKTAPTVTVTVEDAGVDSSAQAWANADVVDDDDDESPMDFEALTTS